MRAVVVYRSDSEHGSIVEGYLRDFSRQTGRELETLDPDSLEGISFCRAHDIMQYPSVIALSDDGQVQNNWNGLPLPTINELSYYSN